MSRFTYFRIVDVGQIAEICLANPLCFDVSDFAELQDELLVFARVYRPRTLIVDFANIPFCSTAIMHALVRVKKSLAGHGGVLKLCGMNEMVRASFLMLDLEGRVFDIHETAAAALAASR
jgi:anti-anti-sigma regulatory factor